MFYGQRGTAICEKQDKEREQELQVINEDQLGLSVPVRLLGSGVVRFVIRVGMGDDGSVGHLMRMQEKSFIGDHQGHYTHHQIPNGFYCYFINNHTTKVVII